MSESLSTLLKKTDYAAASEPYLVEQVELEALRALIAKRREETEVKSGTRRKPIIRVLDPETVRLRREAAELKAEAAKRITQSEIEAAQLTENARAEGEVLKEKAKEEGYSEGLSQGTSEGYEEGLKKGQDEGLRQWAEAIARWKSLLESTIKEKEGYLVDRERILVQLSMEVAAKIIAREVKTSPDDIRTWVRQAIKRASNKAKLVIYVHPEDIQRAEEADIATLAREGVKQIDYVADDNMVRGSVRVESAGEIIDASMDVQLAEIVKGLLQEAYHGD